VREWTVGRGKREEEEGRGKREEGRGKREEGRGKREGGRGKGEEGRGKREEGRGKREEGRTGTNLCGLRLLLLPLVLLWCKNFVAFRKGNRALQTLSHGLHQP
jgi:hypothetical protein